MTEEAKTPVPGFDSLLSLITIDPPLSEDLDDAVGVLPLPDGSWVVNVGIADVTTELPPDSDADKLAQERGFTEYHLGRMKRPILSHETTMKLSLLPKKDKAMVMVRMLLDRNMNVVRLEYGRVRAQTRLRMSYEYADKVLENHLHGYHGILNQMWELAQLLFAKRQATSFLVWDPELGVGLNEDGYLKLLSKRELHRTHIIIQELMILANGSLAKRAAELELPILYRNHVPPNLKEGYREMVVAELKQAKARGIQELAKVVMRHNMHVGPASLGTKPLGHWGLNLPYYAWFTSPIRRYPDIVSLRLMLDGIIHPDAENLAKNLAKRYIEMRRKERKSRETKHLQKIRDMLQTGKVQALRLMPMRDVVQGALLTTFTAVDLEQELTLRMQNSSLDGTDVMTVLAEGRELFGSPEIMALTAWLLEDDKRMWQLSTAMQREGRLPEIPLQRMRTLTRHELIFMLREHFDLPLDDAQVEAIPSGNLELVLLEKKRSSTSSPASQTSGRDPAKVARMKANGTFHPKSLLLEWAMQKKARTEFIHRREGVAHQLHFHVKLECILGDAHYVTEGDASTLRHAEGEASKKLLVELGLFDESDFTEETVPPPDDKAPALLRAEVPPPDVNYRGKLEELLNRMTPRGRLSTVCETLPNRPVHTPVFQAISTLAWRGNEYQVDGMGRTKKHAEQWAAKALLEVIEPVIAEATNAAATAIAVSSAAVLVKSSNKTQDVAGIPPDWSPKAELNLVTVQQNLTVEYKELYSEGEVHKPVFHFEAILKDRNRREMKAQGDGSRKVIAEQHAAWTLLLQLDAEGRLNHDLKTKLQRYTLPSRMEGTLLNSAPVLTGNSPYSVRGALSSRAQRMKGQLAYGTVQSDGGNPPVFKLTAMYSESGQIYQGTGEGSTEEDCKNEAVRQILQQLSDVVIEPIRA